MKQVIKDNTITTVNVCDCGIDKIYAYYHDDTIFKLTDIGKVFCFKDIGNSYGKECYNYELPKVSIEECLKSGKNIYEFNNLDEFIQWAIELCM